MSSGVWVFFEQKGDELLEVSLELISEGRKLADQLKEELSVVLFGFQMTGLTEAIAQYGPERIYLADDERLNRYTPDAYTAVLDGLIKANNPSIFILGATPVGNDLAPRVAARVRTGLASNCDKLEISEEGLLLQTRLTHQNKVHVTVACPEVRPQMATVTPGISKIKKSGVSQGIEVVSIDPTDYIKPEMEKVNITGYIKADPKTIDISDAELIISGGKGVKDEKSFQLIEDLADVLGASIAGSRVAVDNQWVGRDRQIGQSGKTVSPGLMISCGISGASAHTFGMRDTKTLIAINKDKAAPIMKLADLGVVGDLHEILPELIKQLKETTK